MIFNFTKDEVKALKILLGETENFCIRKGVTALESLAMQSLRKKLTKEK